ncbi:restriction endonuclease subunit S [Anabaena sp. FACHB-1250]|nr:restriction endonuclease subunit S [Anabaena sp. FACHB-1250]
MELQKAKFICPESVEKYSDERFLETGDLLLNSTGTGTLGRVCIYIHEENIYKKVVADSHVTVIRPILIESKFIYFWIASDFVQSEIEAKSSGSTKQIELATSTVKNYLFPLPPLNEQKRIVTKVAECVL